jgi:hypothetical protein
MHPLSLKSFAIFLLRAKKRQLDDTACAKIIKPIENAEKFILVIVLADACLAAVQCRFIE